MNIILILAFVFFIGSTIGWIIELLFRRFFSSKKWINPGFLVGPYLPLYGIGVVGLYLISNLDLSFINNSFLKSVIIIFIMSILMTLVEYITGLIFIKIMKIKLWDYSNRLGNIKGIICPLFSFFWMLIAIGYYFLINPYIVNALYWLSNHLTFSFVIGFFYGIFFIDICYSFKISHKIKKFAEENNIIVRYEKLKETIVNYLTETKEKIIFMLPFKASISFKELLTKYKEKENKK